MGTRNKPVAFGRTTNRITTMSYSDLEDSSSGIGSGTKTLA